MKSIESKVKYKLKKLRERLKRLDNNPRTTQEDLTRLLNEVTYEIVDLCEEEFNSGKIQS